MALVERDSPKVYWGFMSSRLTRILIEISLTFLLSLLCGSFASANTDRVQNEFYQLIELYRQRFDSNNKYRRDDKKGLEFIKAQEGLQKKWTEEGYLHQLLYISNSYSKNIWVRIFVLENENKELIAIYWDQSQYHDEEVRSYLRYKTAEQLRQGLNFISLFDNYAVQVRSTDWNQQLGATLEFSFAKDLKKNHRTSQELTLSRDSEWHLKHPKQGRINFSHIHIWTSWFPPNGGAESVEYQFQK